MRFVVLGQLAFGRGRGWRKEGREEEQKRKGAEEGREGAEVK